MLAELMKTLKYRQLMVLGKELKIPSLNFPKELTRERENEWEGQKIKEEQMTSFIGNIFQKNLHSTPQMRLPTRRL